MTLNIFNCFLIEVHRCYFISRLINLYTCFFHIMLLDNVSGRFIKDLAIKTHLLVFFMVYSIDCLVIFYMFFLHIKMSNSSAKYYKKKHKENLQK